MNATPTWRHNVWRYIVQRAVILALGTALCLTPCLAPAAVGQAAPAPYTAPRTSFGQPDIGGYWSNSTLTPMTRPAKVKSATYTEEEVEKLEHAVEIEIEEGQQATDPNAGAEYRPKVTAERPEFTAAGGAVGGYNRFWLDPGNQIMRVNGEPRTSLLTTPNGLPPARKPLAGPAPARPARPAYASMDYETRSQGERCIIGFGRNGGPPMFPNGFYNNNYQIVQTPNAVMIEVEMNHDTRIIPLNTKHRTDDIRPYFGDAIGWWEGDTLVVETTHIPQSQGFMGSWENLKVTERFKRVGKDRLYYSFTLDDPTMWDAAWGGEYEFHPLDGHLFEYACHEGNYALPGILSGNKFDEEAKDKAAADKAAADAKSAKGKSKK
jgi:hypothetical protein